MKKIYLILAAAVGMTITSCTTNDYLGEVDPNAQVANDGAIRFGYKVQGTTRAGEFTGATAADMLGGMFVVEGTKGPEQSLSPSIDVVFDNYLVGYDYNSAATTESNTHNWEYVGKQTGIKIGDKDRMTAATWNSLHGDGTDVAKTQSIKYWDYSASQYDFIAWSTGTCEAVPVPSPAAEPNPGTIQVSRIATGSDLSTSGFTMRAANVTDLMKCYYTDIKTVESGDYGKPVTLTFRNMAAKVRIALYETIPGYSVKNVEFYQAEAANPTAPADLGDMSANPATLFTTGDDRLPQSGIITVLYPRIGTTNKSASPRPVDYNKASVTVSPGTSKSPTQTFGTLTNNYITSDLESAYVPAGKYLGRTLQTATFAGAATDNFYQAVVPNTDGKPLTLRVNYTLVSTDGSNEEIKVYGAKAVVPATYTVWLPNYAYTYVFKISDNTNGWTDTGHTAQGLFPITFDALVTKFVEVNAEQTTVTTVATPSITTYQQGHTKDNAEYSKSQTAGASSAVKDLYVQVMDNSGSSSTLKGDLKDTGKSLLFKVSKTNATEAEVMDALKNHTVDYAYNAESPVGRNGITLTANGNIDNTVTEIVNGVDDQKITKIGGTAIAAGQVAKIDIDNAGVTTGTYAYVYATTVPTADEVVYNVASVTSDAEAANYYEVATPTVSGDGTALANKVYFVANRNASNEIVSYTFKQTKVGETLPSGLFEATIDITSASKATTYTEGHFYFDVYKRNNGAYAVKVIKITD